jgi:glycerol-3-phosphate dehydrogenase
MFDWFRHSADKKPASQPSRGRPFSAATREENLDRLAQDAFDLLIIGGGITGAAIARDAAMRGMHTALVEKEDFASGTSGRSSRLIHGGIRYLEYYQFKLVFEACCERRVMRRVAPRLVRPLPFLYPLYRGQTPAPWKLRLGLTLYDALGLFRNVQRHRWLDPSEVREREPAIGQRGLLGAARFYDAQADDARLTLTTAKSAHLYGAIIANHVCAVDLMTTNGHVVGARLVDRRGGREIEVRAGVVVNATGVWGDQVRAMDGTSREAMLRPTKGVHLVIHREKLCSGHAIVFDSPRDARHVFLVPWGDFALIGTTDTDFSGDLDNPTANADDVAYLLDATRYAFPDARIDRDDVISTFAGLRPLVMAPGSAYAVSREHEIVESLSSLITIVGGKLTTHRLMAEQVVDRVQERLGPDVARGGEQECHTQEKLEGAQTRRALACTMAGTVEQHLLNTYGSDAAWVLAYAEENPALAERIAPGLPYLMAEVPYAVHHEMAVTLTDVMMRRTHVIHETRGGGLERARAVASLMASRLGWDASEVDRQVSGYAAQVALTQEWRETDE